MSRGRVWREAVLASRFGLVGLAATAAHIGVVALLVSTTRLPTLLANTFAFLAAFGISFAGNYVWTFGAPGQPRKALGRFMLVAGGAFLLNSLVLATALQLRLLPPLAAAIASAAIIPVITYLASRTWAFRGVDTGSPAGPARARLPASLVVNALPLLLGLAAFLLVVGPRALYPDNVAWLASEDPATHYLGWLFFRQSPWTFPLGLNPGYGLEWAGSIVYSDSNALLALLLKPFSAWLPPVFQYFGFWLLACFILQAWFAWKILGLVTDRAELRVLGTGFFLFSPPMLWRLQGHANLVGHFLLLAGLYLALRPRQERRALCWGALAAVTALVHGYLLALVGLIWVADLVSKLVQRKLPARAAALEFAAVCAVTAIVCWQAGYFVVRDGVSAGGYGIARMNLLSIVDASGWSYVLQDIPEHSGEYEGFNYLGLGVILLFVFGLPAVLPEGGPLLGKVRRYPGLAAALLALTLFALSHRVGVGSHGFDYPLPEFAVRAAEVFRGSGRMFWPVFYVLVLAAVFIVIRGYAPRAAVTLLGLALAIQVADTHAGWAELRRRLMAAPQAAWRTPFRDPAWQELAARYRNVRFIEPRNRGPRWNQVAAFAGSHGMGTDAAYLARPDAGLLAQARAKAAESLRTGRFDRDSLYILEDGVVAQAVRGVDSSTDLLVRIDGLNVLAPGWKACGDCPAIRAGGGAERNDVERLITGPGPRQE